MELDANHTGPDVELERRKVLRENGYRSVLPLSTGFPGEGQTDESLLKGDLLGSKAVTLPKWREIDFEAEDFDNTLDLWRLHGNTFWGVKIPSATTGMITSPTMAAIDIDIDDEDAVSMILDALRDTYGEHRFNGWPIRSGSGHKICVIVGVEKGVKPGKSATHYWGSPDDKVMGRIELGYGTMQVGVSGVHSYRVIQQEAKGFFTPTPRFEPAIIYGWFEGPTPFDTPVDQLPKLTAHEFKGLVNFLNTFMEERGWHQLHIGGDSVGGRSTLRFHLDTGGVFHSDQGEFTYEKLVGGMNVQMRTITGEGTKYRRGWTWEYERNDGETFIAIHDRQSEVNWLPQEARPRTSQELQDEQRDHINHDVDFEAPWSVDRGCVTEDGEPLVGQALVDQWAANLAERYVFWASGSGGVVVDSVTGEMIGVTAFRYLYPQSAKVDGDVVRAASTFLSNPGKTVISGMRFMPGDTRPLIRDREGSLGLNIWRPVKFDVAPTEEEKLESLTLLSRYLEHLIPKPEERAFVFNWITCVVQHPAERGVALAIVGGTGGTGKNVLYKLMQRLVGHRFCSTANFKDLLGSGSKHVSSEYATKVLLYVAEALTEARDRTTGHEHLKMFIDPDPQEVMVEPKFVQPYPAELHTSTLISSNNPRKVLPIDASDRRFTIVDSALVPLDANPEARAAVDVLLPRRGDAKEPGKVEKAERLIAGLYAALMERQTDLELFSKPLMNDTRRGVIKGNEGLIETVAAEYLEHLRNDRRAFYFADIVDALKKRLKGEKRESEIREVLRTLLQRRAQTQDGEALTGFQGWTMPNDAAERLTPPEGTKLRAKESRVSGSDDTPWRVRGLVVREALAERLGPELRGELVVEIEAGLGGLAVLAHDVSDGRGAVQ